MTIRTRITGVRVFDGDPTSTIAATRCIRAVYIAGTPVRLPSTTTQERR